MMDAVTHDKGGTMPYEILEKEIESLTDVQQKAVFLFVRFLASQHPGDMGGAVAGSWLSFGEAHSPGGIKGGERKLGGFEKDFYMAPDFDAPLEEFAEYM